jgi:TolB-like protein
MARRLGLLMGALAVLGAGPANGTEDALDAAADAAAKELAEGLANPARPKIAAVAVPPFGEVGPAAANTGARAAELLAQHFGEVTKLKALDRGKLAAQLEEKKLAELSGKPSELARVARAQASILGEVQDQGDRLVLSARLVLLSGAVLATSRQGFALPKRAGEAKAAQEGAEVAQEEKKAEPEVKRLGGVESASVEVAIRKLADRMAEGFSKLPGSARYRRLAVLPFSDLGEETKKRQIGAIVTAELATDLRRDHNLLLVERSQLDRVIDEMKLQSTVAEDPSQTGKLAMLADAQALVIGSVAEAGDQYLVDARVVASETGQTLAAESAKVQAAGLVAVARDAVVLRSRSGAVFRSTLIPGWGQFYNRQAWKGYSFLGGEVAIFGSALAFHLAGNSAYSQYEKRTSRADLGADPSSEASALYSKATSRYQIRNGLLIAGAAVWVLNVIDAYASSVDGEAMLSGGIAGRAAPRFSPFVAAAGDGGSVGATMRW